MLAIVSWLLTAVHPRVCGEHPLRSCPKPWLFGSSPRVRGTLRQSHCAFPVSRFIPACAGNTGRQVACMLNGAVHPRVCGEHGACVLALKQSSGSSPRVRGTQRRSMGQLTSKRFIPACAGNTLVSNALISHKEFNCQRATKVHALFSDASGGSKDTSCKPSKSTGRRRFLPTVSN